MEIYKNNDQYLCKKIFSKKTQINVLETNFNSRTGFKWVVTFLIMCFSFPVIAADTNLGSIGKTQLQQDTGDAVTFTCAGFVADKTKPGTVPLFDTCRAMVQTGNEVNDTGGPTKDSLGLDRDELAASLQQIATEEFAATQSMSSEIVTNQFNSALTRLADLRSGVRGFRIAGLTPVDKYYNQYADHGAGAGDETQWSKWGAFVTGAYSWGDRDGTDRTNSFDYDSGGVTAGLDYRFTDNFVLGGALSYQAINSDFDTKPTVSGGDIDSSSWGGFVYGTYYNDNFYIDGLAGYGVSDFDMKRNIFIPSNTSVSGVSETAKSDTDSNDVSLSVGGGVDMGNAQWSYGPYARFTYLSADVDSYQEKGAEASGLNLDVNGQKWKSFTSVLGAQFSTPLSYDFGVVIPRGSLGWVHEFENDAQDFTAVYIADPGNNILRASTDDPDRDYFELGLGVSTVLKGGTQLYLNYDTVLGFKNLTQNIISLGGRWEF